MALLSPARRAVSLFVETFGAWPTAAASAPGRVNLIGEHTDYNGGPVLPVALQRRTAVAVGENDRWELVSAELGAVEPPDAGAPMRGDWTDYVMGTARELAAIGAGPPPARVAVASSVPIGAGLSSSAALTVAVAKGLGILARRRLTAAELVDIAYRAEHDRVGVHCGRMDQTIAVHARAGTAILFEPATDVLRWMPLRSPLWLVETGVSHHLTGGDLNLRQRECDEALALCRQQWPELGSLAQLTLDQLPLAARLLPPPLVPRVRHVVTETARTRAAARALAVGDLAAVGRLLVEGHESLRTDYECTVPEADLLVAAAVRHGAYGARLTGAGWGGAVVILAPPEREARVLAETVREFRACFGRSPAVWSTRAGGGGRRETVHR